MNKIYLLLVISDSRIDLERFAETGVPQRPKEAVRNWVLNEDIGIETISGFKLTEKEAEQWARERCKREELVDDEEITQFEHPIYVDNKCVLVEPNRWEKHITFKGYRKTDSELPIYGYIELLERPRK
jgi:hypothetical protein